MPGTAPFRKFQCARGLGPFHAGITAAALLLFLSPAVKAIGS